MNLGNVLWPNGSFTQIGDFLVSQNGKYTLTLRADGLVIQNMGSGAISFLQETITGDHLVMQADGNLVLYDSNQFPLFNTGTQGNPGTLAVMQDDGNLVLYKSPAIWASNTEGL